MEIKIERTELLTILVSITLVLTLVNLYGITILNGKIGSIDSITGENSVKSVAQPTPTPTTTQPQQPSRPQQSARVQVSVDDDPVKGSENAPVTMIEFSDFQCPFCRKFWTETFPLIKSEYIDTGKVKFVYRDFPIPSLGHAAAFPSAEAAECAREQGGDDAFWKIHDKIFEEQNILDGGTPQGPVRGTVQFGVDDIKRWAQEIGYNVDECLDSGKYRSEVQKDLNDGQAVGVSGTPTFFVNGQKMVGAQPFNAFRQAIEQELNQ